MAKKNTYEIRCTNGEVETVSYKEIFDLVRAFLMQSRKAVYIDASEVDAAIPGFLRTYKKVIKDDEPEA